jgi:hypothetical protein
VTLVRHAKTTILLIGEGACDCAFLNHLKRLYVPRGSGVAVTVRDAHGKGPGNVVDCAVGQSRDAAFDIKAALLDTDLEWLPKTLALARKHRIHLVSASPCLEGLLLEILERQALETNQACKQRLHPLLSGRPTQVESYGGLFSRELLERRRADVRSLADLLDILAGRRPKP